MNISEACVLAFTLLPCTRTHTDTKARVVYQYIIILYYVMYLNLHIILHNVRRSVYECISVFDNNCVY